MAQFTNKKALGLLMLLAVVSLTVIASVVSAATLTVANDGSASYLTVQDAVDNAVDGDTINVTPGVYYETVDVNTGNLTIQNTNPDNGKVYIVAMKSNGGDGTLAVNDSDVSATGPVTIGANVTTYNKSVVTAGTSSSTYSTLQEAVNNVNRGSVIRIENGTYNTSVTVDKNFILFEAFDETNPDVTIDASNTSAGLAIDDTGASEIDVSGHTEVYATSDITLIDAALGGGGGGGSIGGIDFTQTFFGIPLWLYGVAALFVGYYYYSENN